MDLSRKITIRERSHRIHNPFTGAKLVALGQALTLVPGARVLDLACGPGELLCTWARNHGVTGTGIDVNATYLAAATARASDLAVADRVTFRRGDPSDYVPDEAADVVGCVGATWIGGSIAATVELLRKGLRPGGMMLIGEPYWRREPPDQATIEGCCATNRDDFRPLPELIDQFEELGCDVTKMVLADHDSWDRYVAAQWLNIRRWLENNPDDELTQLMHAELVTAPARYTKYQREYLGWGVFGLTNH